MIKLIRANLARTYKIIIVWLAIYAVYSVLIPIIFYEPNYDQYCTSEQMLACNYGISMIPVQGILLAIICSLIWGTDFHNGAIRNKLIVGHTRNQIYLANFLTTGIISLAMNAVYLLFFLTISLPLFGLTTLMAKDIFLLLIDGTLMLFGYCAIYTLVVMTSKNTVISLITCAVLVVVSTLIVMYCSEIVNEEPYYTKYVIDEFGRTVEQVITNPSMPSKAEQNFSQFLLDCLPSGQSFQLSNDLTIRWQMALYSIGFISATSGVGMLIFNKTNLK